MNKRKFNIKKRKRQKQIINICHYISKGMGNPFKRQKKVESFKEDKLQQTHVFNSKTMKVLETDVGGKSS